MIWESPELQRIAEKIAEENGINLVCNKKCLAFLKHCSPIDFLSWIYHAEYVITNSFHGTIFSLLFHKKFVVDSQKAEKKENIRVKELLSKVNLICKSLDFTETAYGEIKRELDREYDSVEEKLRDWREISLEKLKEMLI